MTRGAQLRGWKRQRGVAAVEFALVFPLFFLIFYGILTFGMIFVIQQSLTFAATEGARAALNYTLLPCSRLSTAQTVATNVMTNSYGTWGQSATVATQVSTAAPTPSTTSTTCTSSGFSSSSTVPYYVMVTMTYSYSQHPLIPWLFVFSAPQLQSSATVQISPSML
jgi:Flp pilus assembly protein TadG